MNVVLARAENSPAVNAGCGGPDQISRVWGKTSRATAAPSRPAPTKYSTSIPGAPWAVRRPPGPRQGMGPGITHPGSCRTRLDPSRSVRASSGADTEGGVTSAAPPPCTQSRAAAGPITASEPRPAGSEGSTPVFRSSTAPSAAARRASAIRSRGGGSGPGAFRVRRISRTIRSAASSTASRVTRPSSTAATRCSPSQAGRSGHLEIQPGVDGFGRAGPEVVGDHDAVESPLGPEQVRQEPGVLTAEGPPEAVVRGHHRPDPGLPHRSLERRQIDLAERRAHRFRR